MMGTGKYEVSVIVLTYNQRLEAILLTLESIIRQKDIHFEVVISDDGSECFEQEQIQNYFKSRGFTDYKFLVHEKNVGTMKNYRDALRKASGFYEKSISPGDCLAYDRCLADWVEHIQQTEADICSGDTIYYQRQGDSFVPVIEVARPQHPEIYQKRGNRQKLYYLLFQDLFLGATVLGKRDLVLAYVEKMTDLIMYAEDNIYRVMSYDGIQFAYLPKTLVYYEWGTGVSTAGNSTYAKRLKKDWDNTSAYIYSRPSRGMFNRMIHRYYEPKPKRNTICGKIYELLLTSKFKGYERKETQKRLTTEGDLFWLNELKRESRMMTEGRG